MKRIFTRILTTIVAILCMIVAAAAVETSENPFDDVMESDYFYDSVMWALDKEVTGGVTPTTFQPASTCTRGQVVTFLWRANGKPEPKTDVNPFKDVDESNYFYKAVLWAVEEGITGGVTADTFAPHQKCSRAHAITFLWRSAGKPSVSTESTWAEQYAGTYYYEAMKWAEKYGMIWDDISKFNPAMSCPRADIVTYIHYAMNPKAVPNNSNSKSWTDHIDKYFYIDLVGTYTNSYNSAETALQINTAEELAALSAFTNSSMLMRSFPSKYISLVQDIDLGEYTWEPICKPAATKDNGAEFYGAGGFKGTFFGNNHEIKNLTINNKNSSILGLFGAINGGIVENTSVSGEIVGYWNVGGIAAYNMGGTISNCRSSVVFKTTGYCVGGIAGQNAGGDISDCVFSGKIEGNKTSSGNIGGIAGWTGNGTIENCTNSGEIIGGYRVGGIAGRLQNNGKILNCTSTGKVSGRQYYDIFVGANDGMNSVVSGCTIGTVAVEVPQQNTTTKENTNAASSSSKNSGQSGGSSVTVPTHEETQGNLVWVPVNGGTKYHSRSGCSNMENPMQVTIETAKANGYTACGRCH